MVLDRFKDVLEEEPKQAVFGLLEVIEELLIVGQQGLDLRV